MIRIDTFRVQKADGTFYLVEVPFTYKSVKEESEVLLERLNLRLSLVERIVNPYISAILILKQFYKTPKEALPIQTIPKPMYKNYGKRKKGQK